MQAIAAVGVPVERINWALYVTTIIFSTLVLSVIALMLCFFPKLFGFAGTMVYVYLGGSALVIGLLTAFALFKIVSSPRHALIGGAIISVVVASLVSLCFVGVRYLEESMGAGGTFEGLVGGLPNVLLIGAVIFFAFNFTFMLMFCSRQHKCWRDILVLLWALVIFLTVYYGVRLAVLRTL
ncbi:hypothetical protein ACFL0V_03465 [Nanoarchaeota archaeon]